MILAAFMPFVKCFPFFIAAKSSFQDPLTTLRDYWGHAVEIRLYFGVV